MIANGLEFADRMVRRFLESGGHDPVPQRKTRIEYDDVEMEIEVYDWGRVFFAKNLDLAVGMTWIEQHGEPPPILPNWLKAARGRVDRPECLGWHEKSTVCDGGMNEDGEIERPCAWRDRCWSIKASLDKDHGVRAVQRLLDSRTDEDLQEMTKEYRAPVPPMPKRSTRVRTGESSHGSSYELALDIIGTAMEIGAWKLVDTRFRCSAGKWFFTQYDDGRALNLYYNDPRVDRLRCIVVFDLLSNPVVGVSISTSEVEMVREQVPHATVDLRTRSGHDYVSINRAYSRDVHAVASAIALTIQSDAVNVRGVDPERRIGDGNCEYNPWQQSARR